MSSRRVLFIQQPENDFFRRRAWVQNGEARKSIPSFCRCGYLIMMRPSCGRRFSLMSSLDARLDAAGDGVLQSSAAHHVLQDAVDAEPHAIFLLMRSRCEYRWPRTSQHRWGSSSTSLMLGAFFSVRTRDAGSASPVLQPPVPSASSGARKVLHHLIRALRRFAPALRTYGWPR